ncbi:MAG: hypothetical protein ACM3PP_09035 [Candidatus Saccharibacteria bacterium]
MTLHAAVDVEAILQNDIANTEYWHGERAEEELIQGIISNLLHSCSK